MSKDKGIKPATSKNVEIKLDVLNNEELQSELRTLKEVFEASYGPTGRLNLVQHASGGDVTVTSSSSQILKNITTVSSPLTRLLLRAVQEHVVQFNDGGLFTALLTLQLIESSLKCGLARHTAIRLSEAALDTILNHFESTNAYLMIPADIANMEQMLCVIRSILVTKPATGLTKNELQSFSALLLRGFLSCIPKCGDERISLDNLRIQGCEGPSFSESCLMKGIILEAKCQPVVETNKESQNGIKVALFSSLAGNVEDTWLNGAKTELSNNSFAVEDNVLIAVMKMVDSLVENGVKLVVCQKVIHPTLQQYLTRKGLYFIERLSIFHTASVQKLTGAKLLSSYQGKMAADSFGSLAEIKPLLFHRKRYIHLIPGPSSGQPEISTLMLCAPDEHGLDEVQLVSAAALRALKELVCNPFLLPGGGCFETNLAALLMQSALEFDALQETRFSKKQYQDGLHSIALIFLHIARTFDHDRYNHLVDRKTFHHWITRPLAANFANPQHCSCGLVASNQDTEWYMTEELCCTPRDMSRHKVSNGVKDVKDFDHVVLDVMNVKLNGIKTAFQTANTILRVKHLVRETSE